MTTSNPDDIYEDSETCDDCGRGYGRLIWTAPDELWALLHERAPGGLLCPGCFSDRARALGLFIRWIPRVEFPKLCPICDGTGRLGPTTNADPRDYGRKCPACTSTI